MTLVSKGYDKGRKHSERSKSLAERFSSCLVYKREKYFIFKRRKMLFHW